MAEERDRSGRQWTSEEMILALDTYLDGKGIASAAEACGRSKDATANVIRSDIPRDYRDCLLQLRPNTFRRGKRPFTIIEDKYLMKLLHKGRTTMDAAVILGRTVDHVRDRIVSLSPKQTSPGFFPKEKS